MGFLTYQFLNVLCILIILYKTLEYYSSLPQHFRVLNLNLRNEKNLSVKMSDSQIYDLVDCS